MYRKKREKKEKCSRVCKVLTTELGQQSKYSFHPFELEDERERQINRIGEVTRGCEECYSCSCFRRIAFSSDE
ncbi:hypothetical protein ALC62_06561 [Cyphomyrmex costatus]|uniref:Uncharacterized protein n=1 Tax=Cyphomyrmex costatus TaxID=456900 RepID=A0A195CPX5_9HYME|nr:hypothetical protein ALC62_06561 [Cyphomyrmex costatus]